MTIVCYLDDTYYLQVPLMARAALVEGEALATELCCVRSNRGKQEVYGGPEADLGDPAWASIRGAYHASSDVRTNVGKHVEGLVLGHTAFRKVPA